MHKRFYYFIIIFVFLVSGCATIPLKVPTAEVSLEDLCLKYDIVLEYDEVSRAIKLTRGSLKASVLAGSDSVIMGSNEIFLDGKVKVKKGNIFVPVDFEQKVIGRLVGKVVVGDVKVYEIIIDPGHGGKDPGAIGRAGLEEKDVVLDISKRLERALKKEGMRVRLTRVKDEFISLAQRTEIGSRSSADMFISIHANASTSRRVRGFEVWTARDLKFAERSEPQRKKNEKSVLHGLSMNEDPKVESIVEDMLYSHKMEESAALASEISNGTCSTTNAENRGMKESGFFVLRNTLIPAVLVEVGFLSNPREESLLKTPAYRQKIADGLAESILKYAKSR